jgi:hypothetical protein
MRVSPVLLYFCEWPRMLGGAIGSTSALVGQPSGQRPRPADDRVEDPSRLSTGRVYEFLASATGRTAFWAESAPERDGMIEFSFPNDLRWRSRILAAEPRHRFALTYFGDTEVVFALEADADGGCDLTLMDSADRARVRLSRRGRRCGAGWRAGIVVVPSPGWSRWHWGDVGRGQTAKRIMLDELR